MKHWKQLKTIIIVSALTVALSGIALGVRAGAKHKLRWVPRGAFTAISGDATTADHAYHVRINATMSTKVKDRFYAFRGVSTYGGNACGVALVPSFLHPKADKNIHVGHFGCNELGGERTAELPKGYHVTGLAVCTDKKGHDIKGIKLWGAKLDGNGRPVSPSGPVKFSRPSCKVWKKKVSCPAGQIAHSLNFYASKSAMSLKCSKVEKASAPINPMVATVEDGNYFTSSKKASVKVLVENESHTTAALSFVHLEIISKAGKRICMAKKSGLNKHIAIGQSYEQSLELSCAWDDIKAASGCKSNSSCQVSFKGSFKAQIDGQTRTYAIADQAILKHR